MSAALLKAIWQFTMAIHIKMQNKSLPLQSKTIDKHSKNKEEEKK